MTTLDAPEVAARAGDAAALPTSILDARQALAAAARDYLAIPDGALERPWMWRDSEMDVRFAAFRAIETIDAAGAAIEAVLPGASRGAAAARIAPTTAARWTLHGRLAALDDSVLDRVARPEEWTIRQTLGHIVGGQRGYGWSTRWWSERPPDAEKLLRIPAEVAAIADTELPSDDDEGLGTLTEIRVRLDEVVDGDSLRYAALPDAALGQHAGYGGAPVDIGFRLGRWASHIAEHNVQVDKTLDWLGYAPPETDRIVRLLFAAWGRVEARIFPASTTTPAVDEVLARMSETILSESQRARVADA